MITQKLNYSKFLFKETNTFWIKIKPKIKIKYLIKFLGLIFLICLSLNIVAQVNNINQEDIRQLGNLGNNSMLRLPKLSDKFVLGSPFLEKSWQIATVQAKGSKEEFDIVMKYDIYQDEIMYYRDKHGDSIIVIPGMIEAFTFKYLPYKTFRYQLNKQQKDQTGYYEVYYSGNLTLLKKWSVYFKEKGENIGYNTNGGDEFVKKTAWFIKTKDQFQKIKLKKSNFYKLLNDYFEEVKDFAEKEKIKYSSPDDWVKLLTFYESLQ